MIRPFHLRLASVLICTSLAACAAEAPAPEGRGPPPPPQAGPGARAPGCGPLFVSPAGEPFRRGAETDVCPLRAWFSHADADGDGALTRTEFRNDALRFFAVLDADGNGYVDGLELQTYEHRIAPEILGRGGGPRAALDGRAHLLTVALQPGGGGGFGGGGRGGGGRGGRGGDHESGGVSGAKGVLEDGGGLARFGLLGEPEPVAAADLDFDGRITRVEFATRADQRFRSLDEAEAGRLTYPDLERRLGERARERPRGGGGAPRGGDRGGGRGGRRGGGGGGPGGGFGGPPQA